MLSVVLCLPAAHAANATHHAKPRPKAHFYRDDPRMHAFAQTWASDHHLEPQEVIAALGKAQRRDDVIRLMAPPANVHEKNWGTYRQNFVTSYRINKALKFWRHHARALQAAQDLYGVDAHIIVGLLGVETIYGEQRGRVPTLDALSTLAFDFPPEHPRARERAAYFQGELGALLSLSRATKRPLRQWRGSYAGALGYPQFMPSSWQRWAVDFDDNGQIDLIDSPVDAIGSVAHYLQVHGWVRGLKARWPAQVDESSPLLGQLLAPDILPTLDVPALRAGGVGMPDRIGAQNQPLALVKLLNGRQQAPTYVIGSPNFYAITRYNQSSYYALAVVELGEAVAARRSTQSKSKGKLRQQR